MGKLAILLIAAIIAITLAIATTTTQSTVKCPYPTCKKSVSKTATSCKHCKKKFVTCQKCKRPNAADSNFCIYGCGKLIKPTPKRKELDLKRVTRDLHFDYAPSIGLQGALAFTSVRGELSKLFVSNLEGTQVRQLTPLEYSDFSPAFGKDERILFASARDSTPATENQVPSLREDIFIINSDGTNVKQLTNHKAWDKSPMWTSDGRVVFVSNRDGNDELYVMDDDGTDVRRLTYSTEEESYPSCGPDGRVAFASTSTSTGVTEICTIRLDGSDRRQITRNSNFYNGLSWGPDGRIVYSAYNGAGPDLFIMDSDGSNIKQITFDVAEDSNPSWGNNGLIAFVSNRAGGYEIYTMKAPPK